MAALTQDRKITRRTGRDLSLPVEAATTLYQGAIVVLNSSGNAVKGAANQNGLRAVGVAEEPAVNPGAAGAVAVKVRRGESFLFANGASADLLARADIGATCYVIDDQTVGKTNGSTTRAVAGIVRDVDADGVWVEI